jgi:hypothetical protein
MHHLRRFLLMLLLLARCFAPAGAQNAGNGTVTGSTSTAAGPQATAPPGNGKAGAATGTGSGPQITCFGEPAVLTCLDNAGGTPFQVNCFGAVQYQSCFSFNDTRQLSLSASSSTPSLGGSRSTPSLGASPSDPITGASSKSPTGTNRH